MKKVIPISELDGIGVWHKAPKTLSSLDEAITAIGSDCIIINGNMFTFATNNPDEAYTIDGIPYSLGGHQFGYAMKRPNGYLWSYLNQINYPFFIGGSYVYLKPDGKIVGTLASNSRRTGIGRKYDGSVYINVTTVNQTAQAFVQEAKNDGCETFINLDGGGSSQYHLPDGTNNYGTDPRRKVLNWIWFRPKQGGNMAIKTWNVKVDGNKQAGPHFLIREFACRDGTDEVLLDERLPPILERIRELAGNRGVTVNSGYRTPSYNAKIGGAKESYHMRGQAADISVNGVAPTSMATYAEKALGEAGIVGGIGLYANFVHVDTRSTKWRQNMVTGQNVSGFYTVTSERPTLKKGSTGASVKVLQEALKVLTVDGVFGALTEAAVIAYQKAKGLVADGVVGAKTWAALGY